MLTLVEALVWIKLDLMKNCYKLREEMLLLYHYSCALRQKIYIHDSKWHCRLFEDITIPFKDFQDYSNNGLSRQCYYHNTNIPSILELWARNHTNLAKKTLAHYCQNLFLAESIKSAQRRYFLNFWYWKTVKICTKSWGWNKREIYLHSGSTYVSMYHKKIIG